MGRRAKLILCAGLAGLLGLLPAATPQQQARDDWAPVTPERVERPDDGSWLGYRRTYDATAFSPLRQINKTNVSKLRALWSYSVPDNSRWVPEPVVANGVMYVAQTDSRVMAFDAATGDVIWIHEHKMPADANASEAFARARGVAVYNDIVYWGTPDSELLALDARTGKLIWEASTGDYHRGEGHNHPPLIADGKVFIGSSGGDRGARGRVTASDAKTGKLLWTFYTVPEKGEPGYETWGGRDRMPPMGAAPWNTISYDPQLKLVYFGTGQPTPWTTAFRGEGASLYSDSMIAVDAETGKMRWYFQMAPGDSWDRAVYEGMLVDLVIKGKTRKALIATSKLGWGVVLDRASGEFISAFQTAYDNFVLGWSDKGEPKMNPALTPKPEDIGSGKIYEVCPHWHGARNLQAPSYSKETGLYYLGTNNTCMDARLTPVDLNNALPGRIGSPGYDVRAMAGVSAAPKYAPGFDHIGEFVAFDPVTGKRAWSYKAPGGVAMTASALATSGGIVFGGTVDRQFFALDAKNGSLLWQTRLSGDVSGSPVTFASGGRQYVAVAAGGKPGPSTSYAPLTETDLPRGSGTITVYALPSPADQKLRMVAARPIRSTSQGPDKPIPPPQFIAALQDQPSIPAVAPATSAAAVATPLNTARSPNGLFTAGQAAQGEQIYNKSCSACHKAAEQTGPTFRAKWSGSAVGPLHGIISSTMPLSSPGSLSPDDYSAIIAYMLSASGYPPGEKLLPTDSAALAKIQIPR